MSWCYGNMGGMTTGMWIFGLLWVGIASAAVVAVYLAIARRQPHSLPTDAALVTLRERFARGEIDTIEYQERLSLLRDTSQHAQETQS